MQHSIGKRAIIAGSRSITDIDHLDTALLIFSSLSISTVLSGGAGGVDRLGEQWARREGRGLEIYPAEWERLGRAAGFVRNVQMAELADALLAIWDGESRGTWHMIQTAVNRGLQVFIWRVEPGKLGRVVKPPSKNNGEYELLW